MQLNDIVQTKDGQIAKITQFDDWNNAWLEPITPEAPKGWFTLSLIKKKLQVLRPAN